MQCLSAKGFERVPGRCAELIRFGLETGSVDIVAEERMAAKQAGGIWLPAR